MKRNTPNQTQHIIPMEIRKATADIVTKCFFPLFKHRQEGIIEREEIHVPFARHYDIDEPLVGMQFREYFRYCVQNDDIECDDPMFDDFLKSMLNVETVLVHYDQFIDPTLKYIENLELRKETVGEYAVNNAVLLVLDDMEYLDAYVTRRLVESLINSHKCYYVYMGGRLNLRSFRCSADENECPPFLLHHVVFKSNIENSNELWNDIKVLQKKDPLCKRIRNEFKRRKGEKLWRWKKLQIELSSDGVLLVLDSNGKTVPLIPEDMLQTFI